MSAVQTSFKFPSRTNSSKTEMVRTTDGYTAHPTTSRKLHGVMAWHRDTQTCGSLLPCPSSRALEGKDFLQYVVSSSGQVLYLYIHIISLIPYSSTSTDVDVYRRRRHEVVPRGNLETLMELSRGFPRWRRLYIHWHVAVDHQYSQFEVT